MSQINETAIKTPGVYTTEIPLFPPSVAQVETAVPAFIGYTAQALDAEGRAIPINTPTKIYNLKEYEQYFGKAQNENAISVAVTKTVKGSKVIAINALATNDTPLFNNMYYAIRHFFDNGGGQCYIVSVGPANNTINDTELLAGLNALEAYDEPTLILFPEGQSLSTSVLYYALIGSAVSQCAKLQDRFTLIDIYDQTGTTDANMTNFRNGFAHSDLNYAAAYYPNLQTTYAYQYIDTGVNVTITTHDIATDPPTDSVATSVTLDTLKSNEGAIYNECRNAIRKLGPVLPPSPAIAGVYAKTDATRGVWKAPANIPLSNVFELNEFITDEEQEGMNVDTNAGKSVNAIRVFNGKGILVWGARTLDGNSNEWRYVPVRRLFIMVEESAKKATFPFVFEPNDANTWVKVRAMLENYLTVLWRQGALAGAKPEHAFFVKCGLGQTMTAQDILNGLLIVEIGMAAVRPAEFIILRFSHKLQES